MRQALIVCVSLAVAIVFASTVVAQSATPTGGASDADATLDGRDRIAELIEQLRAPKYIVRQSAAHDLRGLGLSAFDQLLAATDDPDPEVAAASKRLLETMAIRWTQADDPPEVRRLLESYGELSINLRRQKAQQLAQLADDGGVAALCRIARFEASEQLSREAFVRLIEPPFYRWNRARTLSSRVYELPESRLKAIAATTSELNATYGVSGRAAGSWLDTLTQQIDTPGNTVAGWQQAIREEERAISDQRAYADEQTLETLQWNWFRVQLKSGMHDQLVDAVGLLTEGDAETAEAALTRALEWMVEAEADKAVDALLANRRDQLTTKRGLYLAADIRAKQGRDDEAAALAERAFLAEPLADEGYVVDNRMVLDGRVMTAARLEREGHIDWARRELKKSADLTADLSINSGYARQLLARSYNDSADYQAAAEAYDKTIQAIEKDAKSRQIYRSRRDEFNRNVESLFSYRTLVARRDFNRALAAHNGGDREEEIKRLQSAIENDPTDADVLIAMYRVEDPPPAFREQTLSRIVQLADETQEQIDEDPFDRTAATPYNQWAWLISNTEGDYAKAIRYSKQSLKLRPGDAGFLDTLGRCYYAIGDYERAVETQREAVEKQPHLQVMRRQLALFEKALAESKADDAPQDDAA